MQDTRAGRKQLPVDLARGMNTREDPSLLRCPLAETRKYVSALDGAHESSGRIHRIDQQPKRFIIGDDKLREIVIQHIRRAEKRFLR